MQSTNYTDHASLPLSGLLFHSHLLETFIPGFGIFSSYLSKATGLDVTAIVSVALLLFGLIKSFDVLYRQFLNISLRYTTCSIAFDSNADAYHWLVSYLQAKGVGRNYHDLVVISNAHIDVSITVETGFGTNEHYTPVQAEPSTTPRETRVQYEPAINSAQWFCHNGRLFLWQRWMDAREQGQGYGLNMDRIRGQLYCFSRTTAPLKALMREAITHYESKNSTKTVIRRAAASKQRRNGGAPWVRVTTRPSRSLDSVILNEYDKQRIKDDVTDFLSSKTRRWYADRGIPYRRGYLLNGPPGTGKTSLTFALAGLFHLDIYCVSLAEASMTDEDLAKLFDSLPSKCLVLLEDVDAAGLAYRGDLFNITPTLQTINDSDNEDEEELDEDGVSCGGNTIGTTSKTSMKTAGISKVSLSGLLNVIDGVAASEGRVLFMTTNDISRLDDALMRPGRIDMKISFALATQDDASQLFKQIFREGEGTFADKVIGGTADTSVKPSIYPDIKELSLRFASKVPNGVIGQAEIQGYLMTHKDDPTNAIDMTDAWLERRAGAAPDQRKSLIEVKR